MQLLKRKLAIETERLTLRPPVHADFRPWATLRSDSITYLTPWEPSWAPDHLSRKAFTNRVYWANRSVSAGTALPLFLIRRSDQVLVGAIPVCHADGAGWLERGPHHRVAWTGVRRGGVMKH